MSEDALDSLNHLEERFHREGFTAGHAHGAEHGLIEGRALGRSKGFELWEELGYYEAQARLALDDLASGTDAKSARSIAHAETLLSLISQLPMTNEVLDSSSEVDQVALLNSIRSRARLLSSSIGLRPRLTAASMSV